MIHLLLKGSVLKFNLFYSIFSQHGNVVNCRILCDQFTGQSKGVGFVLFDRKSEAEEAIAAWHNNVPPGGTEVSLKLLTQLNEIYFSSIDKCELYS